MDSAPPDGPRVDLASATVSGVRWLSLSRVIGEASNFTALVVLSHLLTPAQYGLAALVLILNGVAIVWTSEGFGNPLVQSKEIDQAAIGSSMALCLASSAALTLVVVLFIPAAAARVFGHQIEPLIREGSLCIAFAGIGAVPMALLQRRLDFRWLAIADAVSTVAGSVISVVLAIAGLGPSALVVGIVATQAINTTMLLAKTGWPGIGFSRSAARKNARYGVPATIAALLAIVLGNEDNVIVGALLGTAALGIYYRAFTLGISYQRRASQIVLRLLFPILSRSTDADHMRSIRSKITRTQALVMFLPLALLVVTAPSLVPMLLGARWSPAVVPTQILAVAGMIGCLTDATSQLLLAAGRATSLMKSMLFLSVVYGTAIAIGSSYGVTGAAVGATAVYFLWLLVAYRLQVAPALGTHTSRLLLDSAPAFVAAGAVAATGLPVGAALHAAGLPKLGEFAVVIVLGTAVYLAVVRLCFPNAARQVSAPSPRSPGAGVHLRRSSPGHPQQFVPERIVAERRRAGDRRVAGGRSRPRGLSQSAGAM